MPQPPTPEELEGEWWHDGPEMDDDTAPTWFAGQHLPEGAQLMGLSHHVPEGALLDFAGTLDRTKPRHRIAAWVMLIVFGLPVIFALMHLVNLVLYGHA